MEMTQCVEFGVERGRSECAGGQVGEREAFPRFWNELAQ